MAVTLVPPGWATSRGVHLHCNGTTGLGEGCWDPRKTLWSPSYADCAFAYFAWTSCIRDMRGCLISMSNPSEVSDKPWFTVLLKYTSKHACHQGPSMAIQYFEVSRPSRSIADFQILLGLVSAAPLESTRILVCFFNQFLLCSTSSTDCSPSQARIAASARSKWQTRQ